MEISVVIPAFNEADYIEATIKAAEAAGFVDIVVCDGGSSDGTARIASRYCRTISAPRGRARQMNAGAKETAGDVLLFLHADTLLPPVAFSDIRRALDDPRCIGGCFRLRFDARSPLLNLYGWLTRLPLKSLCFGDRVHFFRRDTFDAAGGYPELRLFEDLAMVKMIRAYGDFRMLPARVTTSARRFLSRGNARQQLLNAYLWTRYHIGASPDELSRLYSYDVPRSRQG